MKLENHHQMLALAPDASRAEAAVRRFFARTQLVRYDIVEVAESSVLAASDPAFWPAVDRAISLNRQVLQDIIEEMKKAGIRSIDDLVELPQGYQSKLAHTATHLLDGFFGIDSAFFNLVEDSHWISEPLGREIRRCPDEYYLLPVRGELRVDRQRQLISSLRRFES
ncbi:hypothetical protein [Desulfurivibrio alkaliphilus]|uniref:Uncharacterized protein n=1 Tax=Desulfurivibrio alkaliphilus (strain DSM 19089 / UNIQEM U267 / AHT2) TaxID=589865 RepID=D6Z5H5_DESAT|nr:hypothetical protein [Desulfurivibrio alkaliphilus]ADH86712.1 conserved hypothetical protein [Desulfurivibrio alkaliphilus AHT 2]